MKLKFNNFMDIHNVRVKFNKNLNSVRWVDSWPDYQSQEKRVFKQD